MAAKGDVNDERDVTFTARQTFKQKIAESCTWDSHISVDKQTCQITTFSANKGRTFSYKEKSSIQQLLEDDFLISTTWTFKEEDVGVLSIMKSDPKTDLIDVCLLFCDMVHEVLIGIFPVRYEGQELIRHVEMFSCQLSPDGQVVGFVLGVIPASQSEQEECQSQVYFFDTTLWIMIRSFQSSQAISPALSFDPRFHHSRVVIAGLLGDNGDELPMTMTFCLKSGRFLHTQHVDLFDMDGDSTLQISHTIDGQHLIFQVIEWIGYGQEFMYRTYVLDPDTFHVRMRCKSLLVMSCHTECFPYVFPVVFPHCRQMALVCKEPGNKSFLTELSTLPPPLNLKSTARRTILESLKDPLSGINQLNVSDSLKKYLNFKGFCD